jgi:aldehyde oxidoreductase
MARRNAASARRACWSPPPRCWRAPRPTRAEVEAALGGVLCRCTGYAKIVAAVCDAWRTPAARPPPAGAAVGARVAGSTGRARSTGPKPSAPIAGARRLRRRAVRSPHHHAAFAFGDVAGWRAARPRVAAVFTAADIPGRNRFGVIPAFADQPALAEGAARFRGEAVALVAFEDDGGPDDLDGFPVDWTPLPALLDRRAEADGAPPCMPDRPGNRLIEGRAPAGDAAAALASAAHVVEAGSRPASSSTPISSPRPAPPGWRATRW